jgi:hypothetical protein
VAQLDVVSCRDVLCVEYLLMCINADSSVLINLFHVSVVSATVECRSLEGQGLKSCYICDVV